jgi:MarR family transcriptional regulator for hemolysin
MPRTSYRGFGRLIRDVYVSWRDVLDQRLEPSGISSSQWQVLNLLQASRSALTQVEIADALGIEGPSVVRLLDRLMSKGWIVRKPCPGDRRARHVKLTPKARTLMRKAEAIIRSLRKQIFRDVPIAQLRECASTLQQVHNTIQQLNTTFEKSSKSKRERNRKSKDKR